MDKLEKGIYKLKSMEFRDQAVPPGINSCALLITTICYLIVMLSVSPTGISMLILFSIFPIITAPICGESYLKIMLRSLWVLPFILFIGIFNPIFDKEAFLKIGELDISRGWVTFASVIIRGLLGMQAILILISNDGFLGLCNSLRRLKVPDLLITQLQFVFRYLLVMMEELQNMRRARDARSYGRDTYPLKVWGNMMGQLFIRTVDRSQRIHAAMISRGFSGTIPTYNNYSFGWSYKNTLYVCSWIAVFLILRLINIPYYISLVTASHIL
ncbi:MAG: cobalt ECF transporter T component CbiQ [Muribaculaceae bacterium]|nr:cobalt ECF transporter T component CbiQ [Muribaculaceae bacterium]